MQKIENWPAVSVVVVGKNEEKNLDSCFRSIFAIDYPPEKLEVIYVDTGSSDGSLEIARKFGVKIAEEFSEFPTPGLARNRGIEEAKHEIIHFVDGDMIVDAGYLKKAVSMLGKDNIACVVGRVLEQNSDKSILSNIMNYPWRTRKVGFIEAPGAGGTFIKDVLRRVGGYNPNILKGQETELGRRFRQQGYRIYMMNNNMGVHDYSLRNVFDLIHRLYVIGISYGRVLALPSMESYSDLTLRARSLLMQGSILIILTLILILSGHAILLICFPFLIFMYVLVKYREVYYTRRDWSALTYYLLMHFGKPIVYIGVLVFLAEYFIMGRFRQKL